MATGAQAYAQYDQQAGGKGKADTLTSERFGCHFQFTGIGQHQLPFNSPYLGKNSLLSHEKLRLSITSTLFAGLRLWRNGEVYFNPELSGGRGLSSTTGVAGFPNGEVYRVGDPEPVITVARIFLRQTFNLGDDRICTESACNQLKSYSASSRLVFTLGKYSIVDLFDCNTYSHDPRSQFYNWSLMSAGAWDYPANTRGYTYAFTAELVRPKWSLRAAAAMVPEVANGPYMDMDIIHANSETIEFDKHYSLKRKPGVVRFIVYNTFADMGNYEDAIALNPINPDITLTRKAGRTKTGFVVNAEQEINNALGAFARLSWNDGNNETWAFTEIDHSASIGMRLMGARWKRSSDVFGAAIVVNGLSKEHRAYLAAGGYGFIIGDGKLNYGLESIAEIYYNALLFKFLWVAPDYQFILNPAYNKDRGPVNVFGLRGHIDI
jgi:high affinity Mn2+ porin